MPVKQAIGPLKDLAVAVIARQDFAERVGAVAQGFDQVITHLPSPIFISP